MGKGTGKGKGKGGDEDGPVGQLGGCWVFLLVYGAIYTSYHQYVTFDNEAMETWESADCRIRSKVLKVKGCNGQTTGKCSRYKVQREKYGDRRLSELEQPTVFGIDSKEVSTIQLATEEEALEMRQEWLDLGFEMPLDEPAIDISEINVHEMLSDAQLKHLNLPTFAESTADFKEHGLEAPDDAEPQAEPDALEELEDGPTSHVPASRHRVLKSSSSSSSSSSSNNIYYIVKFHVTVTPDDTVNYAADGWNTTAVKWPSWTMHSSALGGTPKLRAFQTIDGARRWRKRYHRGQNFRCFFHPDHPNKVSVKNIGAVWIEGSVIAGYVMLGIALCPCVLLLLFVLWTQCISPCIHEIEEAHLFQGRHPPNTAVHRFNNNVHGIHRQASGRIEGAGKRYKTNLKKMTSALSLASFEEEAPQENSFEPVHVDHTVRDKAKKIINDLKGDAVITKEKAERLYKELHKCYEDIEASELRATEELNKLPELIKMNRGVEISIGKTNFNSYCKPHFMAISTIILEKHHDSPKDTELTTTESANQV